MKIHYTFEQLLGSCFYDWSYEESVSKACRLLQNKERREVWREYQRLIKDRQLPENQALHLVHKVANYSLYETSDREAYKWFDIFFKNVDAGKVIIEYAFEDMLATFFKERSYEKVVETAYKAWNSENRGEVFREHRSRVESGEYDTSYLFRVLKRTGITLHEETNEEASRWFEIFFQNVDAGQVVEEY